MFNTNLVWLCQSAGLQLMNEASSSERAVQTPRSPGLQQSDIADYQFGYLPEATTFTTTRVGPTWPQ